MKVKNCIECNKEFTVNKWQQGKLYCTELCKPNYKITRGNSMSESNLWRYFQRNMKSKGVIQRVENAFYKGMPDVNYLIEGKEGWIELKYSKEYPKKETTSVRLHHFTKEQRIWHRDRLIKKGRTNILWQIEKDYYLFCNENIALIGTLTRKQMGEKSDGFWSKKINFENMKRLLCNQ